MGFTPQIITGAGKIFSSLTSGNNRKSSVGVQQQISLGGKISVQCVNELRFLGFRQIQMFLNQSVVILSKDKNRADSGIKEAGDLPDKKMIRL